MKATRLSPLALALALAVACSGGDGVDGLNSVIQSDQEPPGDNCDAGGLAVRTGIDRNRNGELDESEDAGVSYVCSTPGPQGEDGEDGSNGAAGAAGPAGPAGPAGLSTLTATAVEPAGANCATGGLKLTSGADSDRNGTLDPAEVTGTNYVCNGANGEGAQGGNRLVAAATEGPGANCQVGGVRIQTGADANTDNILDASEVTATSYACTDPTAIFGAAPVILTANTDFDLTPYTSIATGTSGDLATAQITVPGPGIVLAIASTKVYCDTSGEPTWNCVPAPDFTTGWLTINQGTGGTGTTATSTYIFLVDAVEVQLTTTEIFFVNAGTHSFRSVGFAGAVDDGTVAGIGTGHVAFDLWDLTLVYLPN